MRIAHLVSSDRWTGAATPAFNEVEALRSVGIDARFLYVGGYNLATRLASHSWSIPLLARKQNPITYVSGVRRLREYVGDESIDLLHSHLTWDHSLAVGASRGTGARVVRTFHARRTLRRDPLSSIPMARTAAVGVVNQAFLDHPTVRRLPAIFTPPPVDHRLFHAGGGSARERHGIDEETPVVGFIGKVVPGRGFDEALETFAIVRRALPEARLLIIGQGPYRQELERKSVEIGIGDATIWAGYQDEDLASHYRAMNAMLFTVTGSDEGHRAITEAMACGIPVVSRPLEGTPALYGELSSALIAPDMTVDSLARQCLDVLRRQDGGLARACAARTEEFDFTRTAARLRTLYAHLLG